MTFTQTMTVRTGAKEPLEQLMRSWHDDQSGVAPGYEGARLLADQDDPGVYVIEVDFASEGDAQRNNSRPETGAWAERLKGLAQQEPAYRNYAVAYTTA